MRTAAGRVLRCAAVAVTTGVLALVAAADADDRTLADGAWSYFGDPRAVYAHGVTYAGWVTSTGDIQVGAIDGKLRLTAVTLDNLGTDDHNNPSLFFRKDGRLVAIYASHARPASRWQRMHYRITRRPYDITTWGRRQEIRKNTPPLPGLSKRGFAYPNPVRMGKAAWLFWRGNDWRPAMSTTSDWVHWSKPRVVISAIRHQRPYVKVDGNGRDVYLAFTDCHPEERPASIYFLRMNRRGDFLTAAGRKLGNVNDHPVSYKRADVVYRYRKRYGSSWIMDVAHGKSGEPVLLYFRRDSRHGDQYRYAHWDGRRWIDRKIVDAGGYPAGRHGYYQGGATLDHRDPTVVYLSRKRHPGEKFEIDIWATPDQGKDWGVAEVTRGSAHNNWRPVSPRGGTNRQVIFFSGRYFYFRHYSTQLIVHAKHQARHHVPHG